MDTLDILLLASGNAVLGSIAGHYIATGQSPTGYETVMNSKQTVAALGILPGFAYLAGSVKGFEDGKTMYKSGIEVPIEAVVAGIVPSTIIAGAGLVGLAAGYITTKLS